MENKPHGKPMHALKSAGLAVLTVAILTGCAGRHSGANPSGTLEAVETDIASVYSGRILDVRPQLGTDVRAGDTLIVLDTELLRLQRAQSEANRRSLQAQRLVTEDALKQARRNLQFADTTLMRTRALLLQGSATPQQVDELQTKRDVTAVQVSSALHQLDALSAEEEKLNALLAVYDRQIKDGVIIAPQNGTIILRNSEPGELATPGAVLLRLANLSSLELRVYLGEEDLDRVKIGMELPVLVDALIGETLTGKVTWVSDEAEFTPKNAQTRQARTQLVYAIKLSIANSSGKLHIGMPAEVKL
ncbi:HlyD family efflux transporter periplasmic adaptor subunit [candidate division KSB1 bacterium]|nr:MAG: HlyD family efflux transporter periplasmic adaptor subunit [candidate division KSB1 bacterium]